MMLSSFALGADILPRNSQQKPTDPQAETKANEDSTFSISISGGRSETVGSPCKTGRIGGKGLPDQESLIAATSTVDVDSCVESFASLGLHSGASSSKSKRMGMFSSFNGCNLTTTCLWLVLDLHLC